MLYSLADVPEVTGRGQLQQPVLDGHVVKVGALLVAQERVRDPVGTLIGSHITSHSSDGPHRAGTCPRSRRNPNRKSHHKSW